MDVQAYLSDRSELLNGYLQTLLPPSSSPPEALHQAMRHLVFPGGKRLRPALAMAAAEAVGASAEAALPAAAAVELIHTYSLIHDDLPCMDDDTERRGRPTVHVQFGEALAVLAGDALLALAFESLASAAEHASAGPAARALRDMARAAGSLGLVGGQVDDLSFERESPDYAAVEAVHERKTAALIQASAMAGARLAGASDEAVADLERFGRDLGVAFQIVDDLLDEGDDGACSALRVLGVSAARERAAALLDAALGLIENWGDRAEPLRELARFAVRRER